jgi:hypothetical protein
MGGGNWMADGCDGHQRPFYVLVVLNHHHAECLEWEQPRKARSEGGNEEKGERICLS